MANAPLCGAVRTEMLKRYWITGVVVVLLAVTAVIANFQRRPVGPAQPIAFNHQIHAGDYQVPCLYCHDGARRSAVAGVPSVQLCTGCHKLVAANKPEVMRLRGYWERQQPIPWIKVIDEPEFVFFNHYPHVQKGIACQTCHGPVETMPETYLAQKLDMDACVACHREQRASIDCYTCHR